MGGVVASLEEIVVGARVDGLDSRGAVEILNAIWHGSDCIEVIYRDALGHPSERMLYRHDESLLSLVEKHRQWSFDADAALTRLAAEAQRIRLAYHFDPHLAIHSSDVDPLPHQITAVYDAMLPRQPLRFLLADDPGAGKTIMTGLFMKELALRGDLDRCLIVCPGSLAEQWQDELDQKFDLPFEILTSDQVEASRTGNWFAEHDLVICRLDQLSRNESLQEQLSLTDWDLIVCDEAHKMSASYFGEDMKKTKRYLLGELLGRICRHFLLLSATPHNGKEEDFQLFMALLDGDRFEGKYRQAVHTQKADDLMRRMVKEQLVKMDGTPLFPERRAETITYQLSDDEALLYDAVTKYVREEFNRAEQMADPTRARNIGFALTVLQRRLASSPEAIYQSLVRRRDRLHARLDEERIHRQAEDARLRNDRVESEDTLDDIDEGMATDYEDAEDELADRATAAVTLRELESEIATLERLIILADTVRRSGRDRKWEQLSEIVQDRVPEMEADASHRKLIIFTEHRDTLNYLQKRIVALLGGHEEKVVTITGGMSRDERRKAQEAFTQDRNVEILLATDAAGEGINLQRAHLMVNYDLPWNPNRLEQRFGRIHRIGQREVCHLWNLVANETIEGQVYKALFAKLDQEREALGGKVFDVLGQLRFGDKQSLRDLLVEAIRYGDRDDVRARLDKVIEGSVNRDEIERLLRGNALYQAEPSLNVREIAEAMERAHARRLQPHYIASFFEEAFGQLGGRLKPRETGRWEISHVPGILRQRGRQIGRGAPLLDRYERITFDRAYRHVDGKPTASFVVPGHPLLDSVIDVTLERYRSLLKQGAILVDDDPLVTAPRVVAMLEHEIVDGRINRHGDPLTVSKRLQFVEMLEDGTIRDGGPAPYLDARPAHPEETFALAAFLEADWLNEDIERSAVSYAITHLSQKHLAEVYDRTQRFVDRAKAAVHERLTQQIQYWDNRYIDLSDQEKAGKHTRQTSDIARQRRDDLMQRLEARTADLELQGRLAPRKPRHLGAMLVIPASLLTNAENPESIASTLAQRRRIERIAMDAVMAHERAIGNEPLDVSARNVGYDIESRVPGGPLGSLRLIEVKGRTADATTVTVTRNEILTALNAPETWFLALVSVDPSLEDEAGLTLAEDVTLLQRPFVGMQEPSFKEAGRIFYINQLVQTTQPV